ncbi:MAG: glycosyltransferase family 4 protein [Spirochaetes bacterium]|nr:glycosyltransferase family 4 protein [Spirochaetota bacterium]
MIIGIDAYFLYEKHNTGIGMLNLNLIKTLSKVDKENKYILFTPAITHTDTAEEITQNQNFSIIEYKNIFRNSRRIWLQSLGLRKQIINKGIQIFLGGGEYIPIFLPKNIICIVTIHDVVFALFPETISLTNKISYYTLFKISLKRANAIITISNNSKEEIIKYLNVNKPIFVIYNGIDIKKYYPNKEIEKDNYILFVGTLQPRKNLSNVIRAFNILAQHLNYDLFIVGASGWKNDDIHKIVKSLHPDIQKRINFLGYVSNDELATLYKKAKIFVAPSLHEGFGLIILEALASGIPVVTSNRGAIAEVFGDSVEYADPLSPQDIARKIQILLNDEDKQKKMIYYGLEYVKKYDINKVALEYVKIFDTINKNLKKII